MKLADFHFIRKMLTSSLPTLYGLDAKYSLDLDELIHRIDNNQIQEEDEFGSDSFVL
jgi:hypothetical protein